MSFRIQKSNKILEPNKPVPRKKTTIEEILKDDGKDSSAQPAWTPNTSTEVLPDISKGLAIRSSIRAQEDYM